MYIFFGAVSILCLLYYISIVVYAGIHSAFVNFWIMAAVGFAVLAVFFYLNRTMNIISKIPKPIVYIVSTIVLLGFLLFCFLFGCVVSGMNDKPENEADYVIVLGAQIRGERVTKSLAKRLDAAIEYYEENNDVIIIVSGGQGTGEDISEAAAMKKYLMDRSVPEENILEEEKSTTTNENLKFSYQIICDRGDEDSNIVICTNNFHVFRAKKLAKHIGMKNVEGLAAESDNKLIVSYMVRDSLAIFKEFLMGHI